MRNALYASAVALLALAAGPVRAMPIAPLADAAPGITLASGGCGWGWFRAANGLCYRSGAVVVAPAYGYAAPLPPGWFYWGGRRCWWRAPGVRVCN